jgi:hypothetical protein
MTTKDLTTLFQQAVKNAIPSVSVFPAMRASFTIPEMGGHVKKKGHRNVAPNLKSSPFSNPETLSPAVQMTFFFFLFQAHE